MDKVIEPFYTSRTSRKIGLGLPLLKQNAEKCDGRFEIHSQPGVGTMVKAIFRYDHLDRPPSGDMPGVIRILAGGNRNLRVVYAHYTDEGEYHFDSEEIKSELGVPEFYNPLIQKYLKEMIIENLNEIKAS